MGYEGLMWSEKYRPKTLDEVVNQREVVQGIRHLLERPEEMPHLLFSGPPGSGKTTMALIIANTILGPYMKDYTLMLNASDERGIGDVRKKIKTFARYFDRRAGVPFRIIVLDEADEMTPEAQTALRRVMEDYSANTRFILTCNYSSAIIEPIQSRCTLFRFTRLAREDVIKHLMRICDEEGVKRGRDFEEALEMIWDFTNGDVRHAINLLQACSSFGEISVEVVRRVAGIAVKARVGEVVELALKGDFRAARMKMFEVLRVHGISERDFIRYAYDAASQTNEVDDAALASLFAKYEANLTTSAVPEIQLTALLAELSSLTKGR